MSDVLISARGLTKSFKKRGQVLQILRGVDLEIPSGEALCIVGASGAGKSTLLNLLGTLDKPSGGGLTYERQDLLSFDEGKLADFRNREMGFVFQFHHLLAEFTAIENVMMPAQIGRIPQGEARDRAEELLEFLGLGDRITHYPTELSGGEQQRVAIARSLICQPKVLFADEPTGNLDSKNSQMVEDYFFKLHEKLGLTLVVVTHNEVFSRRFSSRKLLIDGKWA